MSILTWIKKKYHYYKKKEQENRNTRNLYKAKKHALLALAYWKDCDEECDFHLQIENTTTYIRLGK